MSDEEPLVSVVTPVYNGARYLDESVQSVIRQTYRNWRHVIVDNVSNDGTGDIARRYAEQDPRVRVVSCTDFVPVIQNWNRAFEYADPDAGYIKFLHADDWLYPECIERMVAVAEAHPSVGLVGAYRLDDTRVNLDGLPVDIEAVDGRALCRAVLLGETPYMWGSPSSTLIRRAAVNRRPLYNEDYLHADAELCLQLLRDSDFGFVHQVLTYTRRHAEAVSPFAARVGTYRPEQLRMLRDFGPVYLTSRQQERRLAALLVLYGGYVARRVGDVRREEFRRYHTDFARRFARSVDPLSLARGGAALVRRRLRGERTRPWRPQADDSSGVA